MDGMMGGGQGGGHMIRPQVMQSPMVGQQHHDDPMSFLRQLLPFASMIPGIGPELGMALGGLDFLTSGNSSALAGNIFGQYGVSPFNPYGSSGGMGTLSSI